MYQYRDGRLYANVEQQKVSLTLPANWWIETDPPCVCDGGISLKAPDGVTTIDFRLWPSLYPSVEEELLQLVEESGCRLWEGPLPIKVGELGGFCIYTGRNGILDACEICVDIGRYDIHSEEGELYDRLDILFCSKTVDICTCMDCPDIEDFLTGIEVEKKYASI